MAKEITSQRASEGGMRKGLKEEKKAIWPTFPLQLLKMATRNSKIRSAKYSTTKNSNLGISATLGNRE